MCSVIVVHSLLTKHCFRVEQTQRNYLSTWFLIDVLGTVPFEQLISGHV